LSANQFAFGNAIASFHPLEKQTEHPSGVPGVDYSNLPGTNKDLYPMQQEPVRKSKVKSKLSGKRNVNYQ
jgi:hypothetical protein